SKDAVGISECTMWPARKDFIAKNRAAMVDFMEDALRILRWYLDPANHEAAVDIFARVAKQPRERLGWAYTAKDYHRDRNLMPDLAALQRNVDLTRDLGFIKASFDVAKQSDLSLVQEAAKRPPWGRNDPLNQRSVRLPGIAPGRQHLRPGFLPLLGELHPHLHGIHGAFRPALSGRPAAGRCKPRQGIQLGQHRRWRRRHWVRQFELLLPGVHHLVHRLDLRIGDGLHLLARGVDDLLRPSQRRGCRGHLLEDAFAVFLAGLDEVVAPG